MSEEIETENQAGAGAGGPTAAAPDAPGDKKTPSFAELGVKPDIQRALDEMGFAEPMEVQAATIPLIEAGKDLMVQSRTGSGKTAAFGIPFFNNQVDGTQKVVQAIVLLPTRELALQVASELAKIGAYTGIPVVPIYGGAPMGRQVDQLRAGAQIVCGTPGRVMDHMRRGTLRLDAIRVAVLDECDEMLSMGFQEDIEAILERTPASRQTLLFSATVPEGIQRLARRFLRDPEFVKLSADFIGVHEIRHVYYSIQGGDRERELLRILEFENPASAIIFCNTREETGRVAEFLRKNGLDAEAISSDLSQDDRERVMARMRAKEIRFMVATDVAARGIDIEDLAFVINYSFPEAPEVYIHRTGRTGRAGKHGTAVSLIGPSEVGSFYYLKLLYKIRPEERALPSEVEIRSRREGERVVTLREALPGDPGPEWRGLARRLMGAMDGERLVAALLTRSFADKDGLPPAPKPVAIPPPAPARARSAPDRGERPYRDDRPPGTGGRAPGESRWRRDGRGPRRDDRGPRRDRSERAAAGGTGRPDRPERPPRGERPPRRINPDSLPKPDEKEFWEAWSEEKAAQAAAVVSAQEAVAGGRPREWTAGGPAGDEAPAPGPAPVEVPAPIEVPEGQARLYLNLGRKDGAGEAEIASLLAEHAGVGAPPAMEVMNTHTYMNVPAAEADRICAGLTGRQVGSRDIVCERARPRGERRPRR